jgi:hypothetical protein
MYVPFHIPLGYWCWVLSYWASYWYWISFNQSSWEECCCWQVPPVWRVKPRVPGSGV